MGYVETDYKRAFSETMKHLGTVDNTVFLGQSIIYKGTSIFKTLTDIPDEKRIELPVFENTQLGMSIGLALAGFIPITVFPRFDFLVEAVPQLVNHLDKLKDMTDGKVNPKVLIRVQIGRNSPLYPSVQHVQDYTEVFKKMLKNVEVVSLREPQDVSLEYNRALEREGSTILVEDGNLYEKKEEES